MPLSYGPVKNGAVVAFKVEEKDGKFNSSPAWMSRDMNRAEPPVIANGVVFAYGSGENTRSRPIRIAASLTTAPSGSSIPPTPYCTHSTPNRQGVVFERRSDHRRSIISVGFPSPTAASTSLPTIALFIASVIKPR